jgi:predicted phosphodiesterase
MRIVCLSDTHNRTDDLAVPDGDVLLHAGDLTSHGKPEEFARVARWLLQLPHAHKVVVAGNHDFLLQDRPQEARALLAAVPGLIYLEDELATVAGLRIWGTPWQPWFYDWAFNLPRNGDELAAVWARVPAGVDVLLSHSPAHGILDRTRRGDAVGCERLRLELPRIRPRLHVFGHIHEAYGELVVDGTHHVNASTCDLQYRAVQAPIVVDW